MFRANYIVDRLLEADPDELDPKRYAMQIGPKWMCPACGLTYSRKAQPHLCIGGFRKNWKDYKRKGKDWTPVYESTGPDDLNPKHEMMRVDPAEDIERLIRKMRREGLRVDRWHRAGDVMRIEAFVDSDKMTEEDMENTLFAYLGKVGIQVPQGSVTARQEGRGFFVLMFPLPGMPAKSGMNYNGPRKRRQLPESDPDDVDPKGS